MSGHALTAPGISLLAAHLTASAEVKRTFSRRRFSTANASADQHLAGLGVSDLVTEPEQNRIVIVGGSLR